MKTPLRVGTVPYLVGRPMDLGLEDEEGIELRYEVPSRLVEQLRTGEIDVALVSSIELFRRPEYSYIAGIGVAGRGVVSSVQLFLRKAIVGDLRGLLSGYLHELQQARLQRGDVAL